MTLHEHAARGRDRLVRAGISRDEAALDARLLAQYLLGWDTVRFITDGATPASSDFAVSFEGLVSRRERREPLAYITGHREFWGLDFEVSPAVLIPRPETELIMEIVLELLPDKTAPRVVADVCTGSGCLAVALAHEYPGWSIVATDVSPEALQVGRRNAAAHTPSGRISFLETDLLRGVGETFHLIVSNPPYVPDRERESMQPEVRDYEPPTALFAGEDGLLIVGRLVEQAAARLAPDGLLMLECGLGQAAAVEDLIARTPGLTMVGLRRDLQGILRVAVARRTPDPREPEGVKSGTSLKSEL